MTKVIAVERGHCGLTVREIGEEFDVDLKDPKFKGSTWFVPSDEAQSPKRSDPNAQPPGAGPKKGSRSGDAS